MLMLTIWKSLIQSKVDYCSKSWSSSSTAAISQLLPKLGDWWEWTIGTSWPDWSSISRTQKKMIPDTLFLQHMVKGYSLPFHSSPRCGHMVELPPIAAVLHAVEAILRWETLQLANQGSEEPWWCEGIVTFKLKLNTWLGQLPDQPTISLWLTLC